MAKNNENRGVREMIKEIEVEMRNLQGGLEIIVLPENHPILSWDVCQCGNLACIGCNLCPDCDAEHEGPCIILEEG